MIRIEVSESELVAIYNGMDELQAPFAAAVEHGFGGFAGGFDHAEVTRKGWGVLIVDRGLSAGGRQYDRSTEFYVQKSARRSERGPLGKMK